MKVLVYHQFVLLKYFSGRHWFISLLNLISNRLYDIAMRKLLVT